MELKSLAIATIYKRNSLLDKCNLYTHSSTDPVKRNAGAGV